MFAYFRIEIEFMCVDRFVGIDRSCNTCKSPVLPEKCEFCIALWILQCVLSPAVYNRTVLHNICMRQWCRWANQLVFITSTVATNIEAIVCHLHGAFFSCDVDNDTDENVHLFQRDNSHSRISGEFRSIFFDCNSSNISLRNANCCDRKINIQRSYKKQTPIWSLNIFGTNVLWNLSIKVKYTNNIYELFSFLKNTFVVVHSIFHT